jgi:hypothetical protein
MPVCPVGARCDSPGHSPGYVAINEQQRPERAQYIVRLFRSFRANVALWELTQGCALGFHMLPFQGNRMRNSSSTNSHLCHQSTATPQ